MVLSYKLSSYSLRSSPMGYIIFSGSIETSFAETLIVILETAGGSFRDLLSDDSVSVWGRSDPIMPPGNNCSRLEKYTTGHF